MSNNTVDQFPTLNNCVTSIKSIGYDRNCQGSKQHAELFTSCLAYLSHLRLDRERIELSDCKSMPPANEIPAISAILKDQKLFKIFLNMLSSKAINADDRQATPRSSSFRGKPVHSTPNKSHMFGQVQQQHNHNSKKRSLSVDETSNKSLKTNTTKSPLRTAKDFTKIPMSGAAPSMPSTTTTPNSMIDINFAVLAAVILYSSCQHLDQWPAIFVKMFAEDSFGPRLWVDDERCKLFVDNLSVILEPIQEVSPKVNRNETEAFVKAFNKFIFTDETCTPDAPPHQPIHRHHQLRTVGSSNMNYPGSESDSGDEEIVIEVTTGSSLPSQRMPHAPDPRRFPHQNDDSSSSGEEESNEEIVISSASFGSISMAQEAKNNRSSNVSPIPSQSSGATESAEWWNCDKVCLDRVRCRFFYSNISLAHSMIGEALSSRVGEKVKQNSSLLMTLPKFMSVPDIRSIAASQLQKWLQSPALSGLARNLFSKLVGEIKNIDPPLSQDVSAIDRILCMTLKANQFQVHVENVIKIVKSVPTITVCKQVVLHLFEEELKNIQDGKVQAVTDKSDSLEMLKAVLTRTSPTLAHNALALSTLILLRDPCDKNNGKPRINLVCDLLGKVVRMLKGWYDGVLMVKMTLLAKDADPDNVDLYTTARIIYEYMSLMVPAFGMKASLPNQFKNSRQEGTNGFTEESKRELLIAKFLEVKKIILRWFLQSFELRGEQKENQFETRDPQRPDFRCVLDGETKYKLVGPTMKILHCLLILVQPGGAEMSSFLEPKHKGNEVNGFKSEDKKIRTEFCYEYGRDVDEELIRIVLNAATAEKSTVDPSRAIELIENMIYNCKEGGGAKLQINDCNIVWDLYTLAEHKLKDYHTHRVACPGLWWRVTVIALIFCGVAPSKVGAKMWEDHPTLRSLIKMTVSERYRFPTVDCDEEERERVKEADYKLRDRESEIVKTIFFPDEATSTSKSKPNEKERNELKSSSRGTRTSARQRAKQERILAIEREEELAREQAEKQRIKRILRVAQKSVMLWDPRSVARKPPKDSVPLILSVASMFGLCDSLIGCTKPDFILKTIGSTSRDGIERAYQWLIPVISSFPSVIDRLPPSASCFLLLRAYGKENSDSDGQLLELSSPLLTHVRKCLVGEYGAEGVKRAADLLFFDISDNDPDRRRCARRVLLEAMGKIKVVESEYPMSLSGDFIWLVTMLETKFSHVIAESATQHISSALFLERGDILHAYIHALQYYDKIQLGGSNDESHREFASNVFELLSTRPHICCAAMDRHTDLRELFIRTVYNGFKMIIQEKKNSTDGDVKMFIRTREDEGSAQEFSIPSALLQASVVLISNWDKEIDSDVTDKFMSLTRYLIQSKDHQGLNEGAASAKYANNGKRAVTVEEWVALAKSRCDFVARESVLSAPDIFLPRLLLCCGLPECSFSSIIDRLDRFGESSEDTDKCFGQLFSSSATSEWGLGYGLRRSLVMRKLYGRVMAYVNLLSYSMTSSTFITWISEKCRLDQEKSLSKKGSNAKKHLSKLPTAHDIVQGMNLKITPLELPVEQNTISSGLLNLDASPLTSNISNRSIPDISFLRDSWKAKNISGFEETLGNIYSSCVAGNILEIHSKNSPFETSKVLLQLLHTSVEKDPMIRLLIKWVPTFSSFPDSSFFELLFLHSNDWPLEVREGKQLIVERCLTLWSSSTVHSCQQWIIKILKREQEHAKYCASSMLQLFTWQSSCSIGGDHFPPTEYRPTTRDFLIRIEDVEVLTQLSMSIAKDSSIGSEFLSESWDYEGEWALLLLLIGKNGRKHLEAMTTILLNQLPLEGWDANAIPMLLLKTYSTFPDTMNLGDANIREILVSASKAHYKAWLQCSTPIDDQISSAINRLEITVLQKQQQLIKDFTKRYPLFALKHIGGLYEVLKKDATHTSRRDIERGRHNVSYPPLIANYGPNTSCQISILHWGSSFSEPMWVAVLDILLSFPEQVLYTCGHLMGLLDLFNLYLTLFKTQIDVSKFRTHRADISSIQRTSNKLSTILQAFKAANGAAHAEWVQFSVVSSHRVMDILKECEIQM